jgi:hypothetical protein
MQSCVKFSEYWRIAVASSMLQAKVIMMKAAGARGQDQRGRAGEFCDLTCRELLEAAVYLS